ncbi:MAG: alpha-glucosidase family protein, partial [Kangiellaceae bacterium]|nr:alpha-glucosidase family protein [Kangiellaceae bacterium]
GVIYQIYPRSFKDTSGNGIGDLQGIIEELDYLAKLGVDAIWISPFYPSPMKDFGYDVADYCDVDPLFGSLEDFDQLIEEAHKRNLKVIIDQVLSHTSDQHAWFQESRESKANPKADWYVWADANQDGSAPNNWLSIFGGCAWQWEPRRQQYYLHNFLTSQPDLNFHHPEVRKAALDNVEFWLKRGVDGFRLDAINFCFHDQQLRDNPAKPVAERQGRGFSEDNPYAFQYHYFNNTQPENIEFIEELRRLLNKYPGSTTLGEISSEDSLATMAEYTAGGNRLHMGYSFELLTENFSASYIRHTVESLEKQMTEGWPCWAISNHDVKRVVSRWSDKYSDAQDYPNKAKLFSALLCSLKGSVCSYQGEELGLTEVDLEFDQLQDPYGITFWPTFKGRDGCRTPMPWHNDLPNAGFTQGTPWLPVASVHREVAVNLQEDNPASVLNTFRAFLKWRKQYSALVKGDIEFLNTDEPVLAFYRQYKDEKLLVVLNLSSTQQIISTPGNSALSALEGHGLSSGVISGNKIDLPAYGCLFASCS